MAQVFRTSRQQVTFITHDRTLNVKVTVEFLGVYADIHVWSVIVVVKPIKTMCRIQHPWPYLKFKVTLTVQSNQMYLCTHSFLGCISLMHWKILKLFGTAVEHIKTTPTFLVKCQCHTALTVYLQTFVLGLLFLHMHSRIYKGFIYYLALLFRTSSLMSFQYKCPYVKCQGNTSNLKVIKSYL